MRNAHSRAAGKSRSSIVSNRRPNLGGRFHVDVIVRVNTSIAAPRIAQPFARAVREHLVRVHEAGIVPDWVIGTSIGAINAALIAGSKPDERIEKMCDFWSRVENDAFVPSGLPSWMESATRNWLSITTGVPS